MYQDLEDQCTQRKSEISKLESNSSSLSKLIEQKDTEIGNLQRTQRDALSELERNEQQRAELQSEVDRYVTLSKAQREEAAAVKARFDRTLFEHREEVNEKDAEIRRIEANCQSQIAAKDAKIAESMKRHEEVLTKCQEQYEVTVASLRASIQEIEEEKENKTKQYIEDKKELETRYKLRIYLLD